MSLPEEKELYGVTIRKLPVGRYLMALDTLERLPAIIVEKIIPEAGGTTEIAAKLLTGDKEFMEAVLLRLLTTVPKELCRMLSELLGIPEERLLSADCKNALSLKELLDIMMAFWEMNDLSDFFGSVRKLKAKLTAQKDKTAGTGYSGGSPSDKA